LKGHFAARGKERMKERKERKGTENMHGETPHMGENISSWK